MPTDYTEDVKDLADEKYGFCKDYAEQRKKYGQAKSELDIHYATEIKSISEVKKNAGYETGLLILISLNSKLRTIYKEMIQAEQNYKALEKIIDGFDSKISSLQSVMKYNAKND